ncbi:MAG TPA: hypothetical protein DEB23_01080 [Chitinophagaceae bacterium]|nr:hypothetical protein [Chitinophagaceae bacterium]
MKLIKINTDHYIIVDDSEIKEGDWTYHHVKGIYEARVDGAYTNQKKITHSTIPKGMMVIEGIKRLSLQEVKELIGEVDVEKKAEKFIGCEYDDIEDSIGQIGYDSFIRGYNQALEDNKDRKYTEKDIDKAYWAGMQFVGEDKGSLGEFIQSLQTQIENAEVREITG